MSYCYLSCACDLHKEGMIVARCACDLHTWCELLLVSPTIQSPCLHQSWAVKCILWLVPAALWLWAARHNTQGVLTHCRQTGSVGGIRRADDIVVRTQRKTRIVSKHNTEGSLFHICTSQCLLHQSWMECANSVAIIIVLLLTWYLVVLHGFMYLESK